MVNKEVEVFEKFAQFIETMSQLGDRSGGTDGSRANRELFRAGSPLGGNAVLRLLAL
jgi:hypothetical protein